MVGPTAVSEDLCPRDTTHQWALDVNVTLGAQGPNRVTTRNVNCAGVQMLRLVCDVLHSSVNVPPARVREPQAPAGIPRAGLF